MKTYYLLAFLIACSFFMAKTSYSYNDTSISDEVKADGFIVGNDSDLGGTFFYIVDKTSKLCFAGIYGTPGNGGNSGFTGVDCDKLRNIPKINKYLGPKPKPAPVKKEVVKEAPKEEKETAPAEEAKKEEEAKEEGDKEN